MAKFNLSITAHSEENIVTLYSKDVDSNLITELVHVKDLLGLIMGGAGWTLDDGDDEPLTTYCQYTCYPAGVPGPNYLLGVWTELDENGCMKL